jgi:hypothetical protein
MPSFAPNNDGALLTLNHLDVTTLETFDKDKVPFLTVSPWTEVDWEAKAASARPPYTPYVGSARSATNQDTDHLLARLLPPDPTLPSIRRAQIYLPYLGRSRTSTSTRPPTIPTLPNLTLPFPKKASSIRITSRSTPELLRTSLAIWPKSTIPPPRALPTLFWRITFQAPLPLRVPLLLLKNSSSFHPMETVRETISQTKVKAPNFPKI